MGVISANAMFGSYGSLLCAFAYVTIELIFAIVIYYVYKFSNKILTNKVKTFQFTWKKAVFLLVTIAIIFGTAGWATQLKYMSLIETRISTLHFICFPVVLATALFYFIKNPNHAFYFMKVPMWYIFIGYLVLELVFIDGEFASVILSGIYLVIAGISLLLGPHKKEAAVTDDDSQPTQEK